METVKIIDAIDIIYCINIMTVIYIINIIYICQKCLYIDIFVQRVIEDSNEMKYGIHWYICYRSIQIFWYSEKNVSKLF